MDCKITCDVVGRNAKATLTTMKKIKDNPDQLARVCRLAVNIFGIYAYLANKTGELGRFFVQLSNNALVIDLFSVLDAVKYFAAKKYEGEESLAKNVEILGYLSFLGAGACGLAVFVGEISLSFLGEASAAVGKFVVFAGKMTGGFAGLAFGCVLIGDIKDFISPKAGDSRGIALLNIVKDIADISLSIFTLIGVTSAAPLLLFGTISAGIGIFVFVYKENTKPVEVK